MTRKSLARTAVLFLGLFVLCRCAPYGGVDERGLPCLKLVSPIGLVDAAIKQPECSASRVPEAAESTKHVKYTELQRLAMAEDAVRIFYPWNEANRFRLAHHPASYIVDGVYNQEGYSSNECNYMILVHDLAWELKDKLPDEKTIYSDIAHKWSKQYGDEQLSLILQTAKTNGDLDSLKEALNPQLPIIPENILFAAFINLDKFTQSVQPRYSAYAKQRLADIRANGRFGKLQHCKRSVINPSIEDYEVIEE